MYGILCSAGGLLRPMTTSHFDSNPGDECVDITDDQMTGVVRHL